MSWQWILGWKQNSCSSCSRSYDSAFLVSVVQQLKHITKPAWRFSPTTYCTSAKAKSLSKPFGAEPAEQTELGQDSCPSLCQVFQIFSALRASQTRNLSYQTYCCNFISKLSIWILSKSRVSFPNGANKLDPAPSPLCQQTFGSQKKTETYEKRERYKQVGKQVEKVR